MSLLVVGSVALDSVETPYAKRNFLLGGSATYFSFSSRFFTKVGMVATVGKDFPRRHTKLFRDSNIDTEGLKVETGKTFKWKCRYANNFSVRHTIYTHLNVFEKFSPEIPLNYRNKKYVFLANIDPSLQKKVLSQTKRAKFVACDTMNYWIENKKTSLLKLLKSVDALFLNDTEANELTGESNLIKAAKLILRKGPKMVIIKKGEHGSLFATKRFLFSVPAYPVEVAHDPTGAGDAFAGGFMGYLSRCGKVNDTVLKKAVVYGTVIASFAVESFGPQRLIKLTGREIKKRYEEFRKLTKF